MALVGDSQSNQYLAALRALASSHRSQFDFYGKTGCIWTSVVQDDSVDWARNCEGGKVGLNARLAEAPAYDVVVTSTSATSPIRPRPGPASSRRPCAGWWTHGRRWPRVGRTLSPSPTILGAVRTTPRCIDRNASVVDENCSIGETEAFDFFDGRPEAVLQLRGAHLLDLSQYFGDSGDARR